MKELSFYDLKGKKKFNSSTYKIVPKMVGKRSANFAVTTAPSGAQSWRVLPKGFVA